MNNTDSFDETSSFVDDEQIDNDTIPWQLKALLIFLLTWQFTFSISNAGLIALIVFLHKLFKLLGKHGDSIMQFFSTKFPKTRDAAMKMIGIDKNVFIKYIVCPCCDACYDYDFCYTKEGINEVPKSCCHIEFPNHPHVSQRQPCGTYLMRTIRTNSVHVCTKVRPIKLYAYQSIKVAMTNLLNRDGFLKLCEHWREREKNLPIGHLGDIYDGRVWQNFKVIDDINFLEAPYNYCFTLNLDWFQPYSHTRKYKRCIFITVCINIECYNPCRYEYNQELMGYHVKTSRKH